MFSLCPASYLHGLKVCAGSFKIWSSCLVNLKNGDTNSWRIELPQRHNEVILADESNDSS